METSGTFRDYFSQGSSLFYKALTARYPRDPSGVFSTIGLLFISRKLLMVIGDEKLFLRPSTTISSHFKKKGSNL